MLKESPNNKEVIRRNKKFNPNNMVKLVKTNILIPLIKAGIVFVFVFKRWKDKLIDENTLTFVSIHN